MTSLATPIQSSPPVLIASAPHTPSPRPSPRRSPVDQDAKHDDKDPYEDVPLAYAVQAKKKKEEKERFLQAEREKRAKRAEEEKSIGATSALGKITQAGYAGLDVRSLR